MPRRHPTINLQSIDHPFLTKNKPAPVLAKTNIPTKSESAYQAECELISVDTMVGNGDGSRQFSIAEFVGIIGRFCVYIKTSKVLLASRLGGA